MITVRYPDEPSPITYLHEQDRELIEAIKFMWGISIKEACEMARAIILSEMDPIEADGDVFEFPSGSRCDSWISPTVPEPNAKVNLLEAWDVAQKDAQACRKVLEHETSMGATLRAYANSVKWLRFWSVRFPDAKWRAGFAQQLEVREQGLSELRAKALRRANLKVLEALDGI